MAQMTLFLLLAFQVKRLLADYYLQFPYMYENKGKKKGWVEPLLHHAFIHGIFTLLITALFFQHVGALYNDFNTKIFFGVLHLI